MRHVYEGWVNGGAMWSVTVEKDGRRRKRPERRMEGYSLLAPFNGKRVKVTVEEIQEGQECATRL